MGLIAEGEVRPVGNYPLIVNNIRNIPSTCPHLHREGLTCIPPTIESIPILCDNSLLLELSRIALTAGLCSKWIQTLHTQRVTITTCTVRMHHCALNNSTQLLTNRIFLSGNFCTEKAIDIGTSQELVVSLQKHQEVYMWEAPLLVLNSPDPPQPRSKDFLVAYLVQKISYLEIEHSCHQMRSVCCCLIWQQLANNLIPLGVSGKHYE